MTVPMSPEVLKKLLLIQLQCFADATLSVYLKLTNCHSYNGSYSELGGHYRNMHNGMKLMQN